MNIKKCPVCARGVSHIEKWRNIYICVPCLSKFEKIEGILKNGQVLNKDQLDNILIDFGEKELGNIKNSTNVHIVHKRGRKKKVDKNNEVGIKPSAKKKRRI